MTLRSRLAFAAAACAAAGGCATQAPLETRYASAAPEAGECLEWYRALDEEIDAAGVRDAQYARVPGFSYLRVDRLAASALAGEAAEERALRARVEYMRELDLESRGFELKNLSPAPDALLRRAAGCGRILRDADLASPQAREALVERARVPDDYSALGRALGLYPLTRHLFARGIRRWEREAREAFAAPSGEGSRVRYAPPGGAPLARETVSSLLARASSDPLGLPSLSDRELALVAAAYAPSFDVEIGGDYDRFGALRWRRGERVPSVDAAESAVYVHTAYTRYAGRVLLQLVYTLWFPERPPESGFDILAGALDGVMWRVTLAPDGEPLLYDAIHPCGCYHMFFPTSRARRKPAPDPLEEWAFVPQQLPRVQEGERPRVSIASATHAIEGVAFVRGIDSVVRYVFRPYGELRSLPRPEGGRRSAFGPDGLIAGTERAERFFFWPSGIASAGAMRQWGRHATAFVGRRHFDDGDLLERRFELDLEGRPE